jgi:DnaJ-domain-containing protein 1
MTAVDIVVIVAGLFFGYRLVSNYLTPNTGNDGAQRAEPSRDNRDTSQQTWQQNWASPAPKSPAWFEVLGVDETADLAQIEYAYRVKMSQYHPDKVAQLGDDIRQLAEAKSKEINAAYDTAVRLRRW